MDFRTKAKIRFIDADHYDQSHQTEEERRGKHNDSVKAFESLRKESYQDQIKIYKSLRKTEVIGMADKIVAGKRRKLQSDTSRKRYVIITF